VNEKRRDDQVVIGVGSAEISAAISGVGGRRRLWHAEELGVNTLPDLLGACLDGVLVEG